MREIVRRPRAGSSASRPGLTPHPGLLSNPSFCPRPLTIRPVDVVGDGRPVLPFASKVDGEPVVSRGEVAPNDNQLHLVRIVTRKLYSAVAVSLNRHDEVVLDDLAQVDRSVDSRADTERMLLRMLPLERADVEPVARTGVFGFDLDQEDLNLIR
jgi:hypothetical protein